MATKHGLITKEFAEEAVRLVLTGGRTQRVIAEDLGDWRFNASALTGAPPRGGATKSSIVLA